MCSLSKLIVIYSLTSIFISPNAASGFVVSSLNRKMLLLVAAAAAASAATAAASSSFDHNHAMFRARVNLDAEANLKRRRESSLSQERGTKYPCINNRRRVTKTKSDVKTHSISIFAHFAFSHYWMRRLAGEQEPIN